MKISARLVLILFATVTLYIGTVGQVHVEQVSSPTSAKLNRDRGLNMLSEIKGVIKDLYYDNTFHGINVDERFKVAAERIKKMDSNRQIFRVIAQVLFEFDDSHTRFYPPGRANRVQYGFTLQMIGVNCFVTDVQKGSDAEKKGLKRGDVVVGIGSYAPTRDNLWVINYLFYDLDPQERLKVFVKTDDGKEKEIVVEATFKSIKERQAEAEKKRKEKKENPYKCQTISGDLIACRLDTFSVDKKYVDKMMKEVGAHKKMILDLRGNRGGYVKTCEYLTGHFFEKDTKIADFVMRKKTKESIAKSKKENVFKGDLFVLIDSNSASASEVFSRVVQIEKRGKVIGDVSAGAVMTSNFITMANERGVTEFFTYSVFGLNVTIADLVMSDGKRLEKVGVVPDYPVGPTSHALVDRSDPVLAFAAKLAGSEITADAAGKLNFLKNRDEDEEDDESDVRDS